MRIAQFTNDDGTVWRFDTLAAPTGWNLTPFVAQDGWSIEDNPARGYGTSRYQARSAAIGHNDEAFIMAPAIAVGAGNSVMSGEIRIWRS
jgi:hypothetical protein